MLRLLADENIPKKLVTLLKQYGVDVHRVQEWGVRGASDRELVSLANELKRTILTRDSDFITANLLKLARFGVVYLAYQPPPSEIPSLAERIASLEDKVEPKRGLLVVVDRNYTELYDHS